MASMYPLEVVEAERFLKQNPALRGQALDDELATKNWDPSVQSLAAYPKVLIMTSEKLEWTQRLGNAFLENQGRVMETVQELRRRAEATGNLKSSAEQTVVQEKETIIIEPAQTEVVYVVEYDPAVVYGAWWYVAAYDYYERYYGRHAYSVSGDVALRHHAHQLFSFDNRQERDVLLLHLAQRGERRGAGRDADDRLALLRDQRARCGEWHELLERARARLH